MRVCKKCKKVRIDLRQLVGCDGFQGVEEVESRKTLFCVSKGGLCPPGCVHEAGKTACGAIE